MEACSSGGQLTRSGNEKEREEIDIGKDGEGRCRKRQKSSTICEVRMKAVTVVDEAINRKKKKRERREEEGETRLLPPAAVLTELTALVCCWMACNNSPHCGKYSLSSLVRPGF